MRWVALLVLMAGTAGAAPDPLVEAQRLLEKSAREHDAADRFRLADEAEAACQRAIARNPQDPLPHIVLSHALSVNDLEHPEACRPGRCERAVDELKKARALDKSGIEAERIASELGIALSRLGRFDEALGEYDRALTLVEADRRPNSLDDDGDRAILYGNSAETLMGLGRLDEAIERYRRAAAASETGSVEWQLAEWGLGVALDRDEQVEKARAAIAGALERDPTMARLSEDGVFFEPAGDKMYYEALGHEVAGDRKLALEAWNAYVQAQPNARWARRARVHITELKRTPLVEVPGADEVEVGVPIAIQMLRLPEQIVGTVRRHRGDLVLCYTRALRASRRAAQGEIRLALELIPQGWPMPGSHILETTVADPNLVRCVEQAASSWRFDAVSGERMQSVIIPLRFGKQP